MNPASDRMASNLRPHTASWSRWCWRPAGECGPCCRWFGSFSPASRNAAGLRGTVGASEPLTCAGCLPAPWESWCQVRGPQPVRGRSPRRALSWAGVGGSGLGSVLPPASLSPPLLPGRGAGSRPRIAASAQTSWALPRRWLFHPTRSVPEHRSSPLHSGGHITS